MTQSTTEQMENNKICVNLQLDVLSLVMIVFLLQTWNQKSLISFLW